MKYYLLTAAFIATVFFSKAQSINNLPPGNYATKTKTAEKAWERGDIVIIDNSHYKLTSSGDVGEYKFSVAAQRIFFTSGPLKSAFTKVTSDGGKPIIILPKEENGSLGLTSEIWASKQ